MARVCVIGAGILGLTTAMKLVKLGHLVTVLHSEKRRPTSPTAAAFFYPFACNGGEPIERSLALPTLDFLDKLTEIVGSGVRYVRAREYFDDDVSSHEMKPRWWMLERKEQLAFRPIPRKRLPKATGTDLGRIAAGWELRLPVADMPVLLRWLRMNCGATLREFDVTSLLEIKENIEDAESLPPFDIYVNCTGIWSPHLIVDRELTGVKGVIVRTPTPVDSDTLVFLEKGRCEARPVYIVPHLGYAVLGGTLEKVIASGRRIPIGDSSPWKPSLSDARAILTRCQSVLPELRKWEPSDSELLERSEAAPRPVRESKPRIEIDPSEIVNCLIHNYGHGGSGLTMCWGSAEEVARLVTEVASPVTN